LETTSFFVKRNAEVITKAEQIKNIERNRTKLSNNKTGMVKFRETTTEIQEHKNWATVSGGACFERNGEIVSQCEFFELWLIVENRWKIASLCIEDID
jgi:hypothetical protein